MRRRRLLSQRSLEMERLESRELLALLSSGNGEGHLQVWVNEFGAFGRSGDLEVASPLNPNGPREVNDAFYDPIGPLGSAGTVFESGLAVKVGSDPVTFLTAGTIANSGNFTNGLFQVPVNPNLQVLNSTFWYPASAGPQGQGATLRIDLRQELILKLVSGSAPVGVTLRQTYTVTNLTATATTLEIFRYLDGDLLYDGNFNNDGAGMRQIIAGEPERVWMTNTATNSNRNEAAYIEVRSNLLPDSSGVPSNPRTNRWEVGLANRQVAVAPNPPYSAANPGKNQPAFLTNAPLVQKILNDGPLSNDIIRALQADLDGNNKVDNTAPDDWAVALRNTYTLTGVNAAIVYTTDTQFGDPEIGDPEPIVIPSPTRGTVTGTVYSDSNSNGNQDSGEFGTGGFRVYADINNNNRYDGGEPSATTNVNGFYSFVLNTGTYNVRMVQQPYWTLTEPASGFYTVTLVNAGDVATNVDFGNHATPGSISGLVFEDFNKNGAYDLGEPGLGGVFVYADVNNNGVFELNEPNATSAPGSGVYVLGNLDPRTYVIRQVVPAGYDQSLPAGNAAHVFSVAPAQNIGGVNFGNILRPGSVDGKVYSDINHNGLIDPGEPGAAGIIIWVDRDNDCKIGLGENAIITGADGRFGLLGVRPGTYNVRMSLPAGYEAVLPGSSGGCSGAFTVTVLPGQGSINLDFLVDPTATQGLDYGDAPWPYPTTLAQDGARSTVMRDFGLGALQDGEPNGQPSELANADNYTGIDDEDGVQWLTPMIPGQWAVIRVTVESGVYYPGQLQGFVDFNRDGDWNDSGERIVLDRRLGTGVHDIAFMVPANAQAGRTYARFRYAYEFGLGPTGASISGEVEDYMQYIVGDVPQATPDNYTFTSSGTPIQLFVTANDVPSKYGNFKITGASITSPGDAITKGTVTIAADGLSLWYTPTGYLANEVITYTISNDPLVNDPNVVNSSTTTATITLIIPPKANDDMYFVADALLAEASDNFLLAPNALANDFIGTGTALQIVGDGVNLSGTGGQLIPSADGKTFQYIAPSTTFAGIEQFQYTVINGAALTSTAIITIQVDPANDTNNIVKLGTGIFLPNGTEVLAGAGLAPGQQFYVEVTTDDLRTVAQTLPPSMQDFRGVYAAYMDLLFDQNYVQPNLKPNDGLYPLGFEITFGDSVNNPIPDYGSFLRGDLNSLGLINEVGASVGGTPATSTGPDERLLFTVWFTVRTDLTAASNGADVEIKLSPADNLPQNNTLVFAPDQPPPRPGVLIDEIEFTQASFEINTAAPLVPRANPEPPAGNAAIVVAGTVPTGGSNGDPITGSGLYRNATNPFDVNQDGFVSPIDALMIVNMINAKGPRSLVGDVNPATLAQPLFLDVDGDDSVTPYDALLIVNRMNIAAGGEAPMSTDVGAEFAAASTSAFARSATPTSLAVEVQAGATVTLPSVQTFVSTATTNSSSVTVEIDDTLDLVAADSTVADSARDLAIANTSHVDFGLSTASSGNADEEDFDSILDELAADTCTQ
ncbi:MAG TPA: SdrD B-like domain-containing protein [Pirellulaceae bacterium]|nr:SdrD B-like domain-containing protein [Pirellulaceae bacterium]